MLLLLNQSSKEIILSLINIIIHKRGERGCVL